MCLEYENGCFRLEIKTCNFMDRLLNNLVLSEKVQIALFTSYFSFRKLKKILHIQINSIQACEMNNYFLIYLEWLSKLMEKNTIPSKFNWEVF